MCFSIRIHAIAIYKLHHQKSGKTQNIQKRYGWEGVTFVQMDGCIIVQYFAEEKHFHPPNPTSCSTSFHPCKELRFLFGVQTA